MDMATAHRLNEDVALLRRLKCTRDESISDVFCDVYLLEEVGDAGFPIGHRAVDGLFGGSAHVSGDWKQAAAKLIAERTNPTARMLREIDDLHFKKMLAIMRLPKGAEKTAATAAHESLDAEKRALAAISGAAGEAEPDARVKKLMADVVALRVPTPAPRKKRAAAPRTTKAKKRS